MDRISWVSQFSIALRSTLSTWLTVKVSYPQADDDSQLQLDAVERQRVKFSSLRYCSWTRFFHSLEKRGTFLEVSSTSITVLQALDKLRTTTKAPFETPREKWARLHYESQSVSWSPNHLVEENIRPKDVQIQGSFIFCRRKDSLKVNVTTWHESDTEKAPLRKLTLPYIPHMLEPTGIWS